MSRINNISEDTKYSNESALYNRLCYLEKLMLDLSEDSRTLRNFIYSINNEVIVCNEQITSYLEANKKRIELLKELNEKLSLNEYKVQEYMKDYMESVPKEILKGYKEGLKVCYYNPDKYYNDLNESNKENNGSVNNNNNNNVRFVKNKKSFCK